MFETLILILDATLRVSTPLILAALAGLFSERSGIVDIGLEGKMLGGAFAAAAAAAVFGSAWIGLLFAIGASVCLALIHGFACITHRGDHIVSGVAINTIVAGLTVTLGLDWFSQGGQTPALTGDARFTPITLPFAEQVADVPVIGLIYSELLSGHNILVYLAFAFVPATYWVVFKTRFGLRLRAVGENPHAVDTAGISVALVRYRAVIICGVLCGIAGAYLSTAHNAGFLKDMSAGKGYMALAALIFGKWRPVPVLCACLLFGFLDAVAVRLQGVSLPGIGEVPVQAIEVLPYVLTVLLLAGFIGKAVGPKAIGKPYVKERA
ncbi:Branched-chain amino acid transport system / permease component [Marinomonas gallaica]|uniref:Branched-chain amino acid transport system / permease component n=1 Tax=Marinomonas gallaica TaxID=1806667 RepID=A0A1C3JPN3_9GAMM|nr:ABC transporter permease [Marinomonas gallaica]SBT16979.1 Branched-chain amino acid transport system / permease component [Marinomonas gallaica]SBT22070.1 Branched-chain amino acid transport system / permease component [Marinomonas gallaica]